jgi:anaerobic magnesium-protoporphyrin IX monomethyl ester cyclase
MGRGCVYKCTFCAYNALSAVRFYSAEYLVDQVAYMEREFEIDSVYFTDSTIGNNRKLIVQFCELMMQRSLSKRIEWYANMRPNQVTEALLKLMWRAGCRFLFYGFESGSQRVLDLMVKGVKLEDNYRAAELHNKLKFPYHASMLLGYPGEREEDILATFAFLEKTTPPIVGINWYVPLPGSPDYDKLKAEGVISTNDPWEWRRIGEVNSTRVYADVPEQRFRELYAQAERLAYVDTPKMTVAVWGCLAPPQSAIPAEDILERGRLRSTFGTIAMKLLRAVRI